MRRFRTLSWAEPNPPAGQGAVFVPTPIQRVRLSSLLFTFTADATVANRFVWLRILDPTNVPVFGTGSATAIAASGVSDFIASTAFTQVQAIQGPVNAAIALPIPDRWLPPGWKIQVGGVAEDSGDQFSAITFAAEYAEDIWNHEQDQALAMAFLSSLTP